MDFKLASKTLVLAIASGSFALTAIAQWQWIDKDGRKVFSDRSPPAEIQDKDILKRPSGSLRQPVAAQAALVAAAAAAKPASAASAPVAKASAPKLSGKDAELEAKKKKAEEEEEAKKKAEDDKLAKARAENCERAKTSMLTLKSGVRMSSMNAKGEQEVYDDAKRASETKRVQEIIDSSCK
ncbi:MAG: DUF4124 domain-containing protein [Pseudomonadota bacterium]